MVDCNSVHTYCYRRRQNYRGCHLCPIRQWYIWWGNPGRLTYLACWFHFSFVPESCVTCKWFRNVKQLILWTLGSIHVSVPPTLSFPYYVPVSVSVSVSVSVLSAGVITTFHLLTIYIAHYQCHIFLFLSQNQIFVPNHDYISTLHCP